MKKAKLILLTLTIIIANNIFAQNTETKKINWMSFEEAIKLNETAPKKNLHRRLYRLVWLVHKNGSDNIPRQRCSRLYEREFLCSEIQCRTDRTN